MICTLIFDFDGLIVDTETPAFVSWQKVYTDYGQTLTLELWQNALGRRGGEGFRPLEHLQTLVGNFDTEAIAAKRWDHKMELCHQEHVRPGVLKTLLKANELNLTCVVASSSRRNWVELWLVKHDLLKHFAFIRTGDEVIHAKSAPEIFLSVAHQINVDQRQFLVFEDSPNGAQAALSAGMPCVVVTNPVTKSLAFPEHLLKVENMYEINLENILLKY